MILLYFAGGVIAKIGNVQYSTEGQQQMQTQADKSKDAGSTSSSINRQPTQKTDFRAGEAKKVAKPSDAEFEYPYIIKTKIDESDVPKDWRTNDSD